MRPGGFNPERIPLNDEVLRSLGATLPNLDVGVMANNSDAYRVQLTAPLALSDPGVPLEVAQLADPDELDIAMLNVETLAAGGTFRSLKVVIQDGHSGLLPQPRLLRLVQPFHCTGCQSTGAGMNKP